MRKQTVSPARWPFFLTLYAAGGIATAIGPGPASWLQSLGAHYFNKPGLGIFAAINLLMPVWAAMLAVLYPRYRTAVAGGILLMAAFVLTRLLCLSPRFWTWNPGFILNYTSPIEVVAMLGYIAIGAFFVAITKPWRRVAQPDEHLRCEQCGYLLPGSPGPACPECNAPFDPEAFRARSRA